MTESRDFPRRAPARCPPRPGPEFRPALRERLEELAASYGPEFLWSDPLQIPHRYPRPEDREIASLVVASLAFGNVSGILASSERVLRRIGPSPSAGLRDLVRTAERRGGLPGVFRGPLHRWIRGEDLERFLVAAGRLREEHGTLGDAFADGLSPKDPDVGPALTSFVDRLRGLVPEPVSVGSRGNAMFYATPAGGSACKRWNLLLRWCVRPADGLDLGLWTGVSPRLLILPLDVHVGRLVRLLRLSRRRTVDWKTAREATATLRRFDPEDPIRYDFALCRLGMLERRGGEPRTRAEDGLPAMAPPVRVRR